MLSIQKELLRRHFCRAGAGELCRLLALPGTALSRISKSTESLILFILWIKFGTSVLEALVSFPAERECTLYILLKVNFQFSVLINKMCFCFATPLDVLRVACFSDSSMTKLKTTVKYFSPEVRMLSGRG